MCCQDHKQPMDTFLNFVITDTFINLFHLQKNLHTEIINSYIYMQIDDKLP